MAHPYHAYLPAAAAAAAAARRNMRRNRNLVAGPGDDDTLTRQHPYDTEALVLPPSTIQYGNRRPTGLALARLALFRSVCLRRGQVGSERARAGLACSHFQPSRGRVGDMVSGSSYTSGGGGGSGGGDGEGIRDKASEHHQQEGQQLQQKQLYRDGFVVLRQAVPAGIMAVLESYYAGLVASSNTTNNNKEGEGEEQQEEEEEEEKQHHPTLERQRRRRRRRRRDERPWMPSHDRMARRHNMLNDRVSRHLHVSLASVASQLLPPAAGPRAQAMQAAPGGRQQQQQQQKQQQQQQHDKEAEKEKEKDEEREEESGARFALPTYAYFVGYTSPEASVPAHLDREQCAVSLILCVEAAATFPLSVDRRSSSESSSSSSDRSDRSDRSDGVSDVVDVHLHPGDVLALHGTDHVHFRRRGLLAGDRSMNVLLHYVEGDFQGRLY
eukprot:g1884.t1